jgi:hypothetical protein
VHEEGHSQTVPLLRMSGKATVVHKPCGWYRNSVNSYCSSSGDGGSSSSIVVLVAVAMVVVVVVV